MYPGEAAEQRSKGLEQDILPSQARSPRLSSGDRVLRRPSCCTTTYRPPAKRVPPVNPTCSYCIPIKEGVAGGGGVPGYALLEVDLQCYVLQQK